jgi:hypothetical protein
LKVILFPLFPVKYDVAHPTRVALDLPKSSNATSCAASPPIPSIPAAAATPRAFFAFASRFWAFWMNLSPRTTPMSNKRMFNEKEVALLGVLDEPVSPRSA